MYVWVQVWILNISIAFQTDADYLLIAARFKK